MCDATIETNQPRWNETVFELASRRTVYSTSQNKLSFTLFVVLQYRITFWEIICPTDMDTLLREEKNTSALFQMKRWKDPIHRGENYSWQKYRSTQNRRRLNKAVYIQINFIMSHFWTTIEHYIQSQFDYPQVCVSLRE